MSVPFGSVHTINVSISRRGNVSSHSAISLDACDVAEGVRGKRTLLFLIAVILGDFCLQEHTIRLILRLDEYPRLILGNKEGIVSESKLN